MRRPDIKTSVPAWPSSAYIWHLHKYWLDLWKYYFRLWIRDWKKEVNKKKGTGTYPICSVWGSYGITPFEIERTSPVFHTIIVGHKCTYEGRIPEDGKVDKIKNWGPCLDLTDVCSFLGTAGILQIYVRNYSLLARPLVNLTHKGVEFFWGPDQEAAQEALKQEIINSPALCPINYKSEVAIILAVNTSTQAVRYAIFQEDPANPKWRYPSRFGSIPLNSVESKYSQPKLKLYGLYRTLKEAAIWIIGVKNFVVEVDATAIKGMINNPDMNLSAVINWWVAGILLFDFKLVHIPEVKHSVDGLSRRRPQPGDEPPQGDNPDWVDKMYGFVHIINPLVEEWASGHKILSPMWILANWQIHPQAADPISADADIEIPWSAKAKSNNARVLLVQDYLSDFHVPASMTEDQKRTFINYASGFFLLDNNLWKRDSGGEHKLVVPADRQYRLLQITHDELRHKGIYSVRTHLLKRYWWPQLLDNVKWFMKMCHMCQIRQTDKWHIPPVVAYPAPLFSKVYIDTFHLPKSNGFKYIVHAHCSMSAYPKFKMLRHENAEGIMCFIFEHIICHWGSLWEIVMDNGPAFLAALEILATQYDIHHIAMSAYNSQAQGVIERRHCGFREYLFKACGGVENKWSQVAHAVIWVERVTPLRTIGKKPLWSCNRCRTNPTIGHSRSFLPGWTTNDSNLYIGSHSKKSGYIAKATCWSGVDPCKSIWLENQDHSVMGKGTCKQDYRLEFPAWHISPHMEYKGGIRAQPQIQAKISRPTGVHLKEQRWCPHPMRSRWHGTGRSNSRFPLHSLLPSRLNSYTWFSGFHRPGHLRKLRPWKRQLTLMTMVSKMAKYISLLLDGYFFYLHFNSISFIF